MLRWAEITRRSAWQSISDVRRTFRTADRVCECVVFDLLGNNDRLITGVNYAKQAVTLTASMSAGAGKRIANAKPQFSRKRYLELLPRAMPRVITTGEELERATRLIEPYLFPERELPPEENAFVELMLKLIDDYQSKNSIIPQLAPHELLQALMEENDLSQADLLDVFGSRSRVSEAVSGKRAISKEQAKRLGDRFRVSPAAFIYSGFQMRATPLVRLRPRRQSLAGVSS